MKSSQLTWTVGVVALLSAACISPAQAQFTDPFGDALETLGIKPKSKEPIVYRERAPLVVPPKADRLRPPEDGAGNRNARWPQDPDVIASRKRKAEELLPMAPDTDLDPSQGGIVRGQEFGKRNRYAGVPVTPNISNNEANPAMGVSPAEVRRLRAETKTSEAPAGTEPDRQFLTEPPIGYRRPSANAPMRSTLEPMQVGDEKPEMNIMRPRR